MKDFNFSIHTDLFSASETESLYVIDVAANGFCYVSQNDLFLCGRSVDEALLEGIDFYKKNIYKDDLHLWMKMFNAILLFLRNFEEKHDEIEYFSCTFRLQKNYSNSTISLPLMVFHRLIPVWADNKALYLICSVVESAASQAGNLRMYNKGGLTFEQYNAKTQYWNKKIIEPLTEREKAILLLSKQGKTTKEIANFLNRGFHTIRNQITALYKKLEVNSMLEAIDFTSNHCMIYFKEHGEKNSNQLHVETPLKSERVPITAELLQRVQQHLDGGKNNREAAKLEGVSEGIIRYWIKNEKLTKC